MKTAWILTTGNFAKKMKTILDNSSELEFISMILELLELSYRTLTTMLPPKPKRKEQMNFNYDDPSGFEAAGSRIIREVEKLANQDKMPKAMQRLLSNGSAGNSERYTKL